MRSAILCLSAVLLVLLAAAARSQPKVDPNVAPTPHRKPEYERKLFHLPPGFEIQLVAAEPDIHKPLNIAFELLAESELTNLAASPLEASRASATGAYSGASIQALATVAKSVVLKRLRHHQRVAAAP